jgi:hypothetical protein
VLERAAIMVLEERCGLGRKEEAALNRPAHEILRVSTPLLCSFLRTRCSGFFSLLPLQPASIVLHATRLIDTGL